MKKSTLALSVIAALGGLGFAGGALAIGAIGGATATSLVLNADGIGHQLIIPYFTVQGDNATLMNITNTDLVNGKVVKVRFRGAANSDDLFDFQVLMSPGDVWTATLTQDPVSKIALLKTTDKTCVLPAGVAFAAGNAFATSRVDPTPVKGNTANETREGYVEILNMADIPPGAPSALFTAIKHVAGVAPCTAATLETALGTDVADVAGANGRGMTSPTGGLTSDWIILNQANTAAWSGSATALEARIGAARAAGNLNFWPQKFGAPAAFAAATADPLLVIVPAAGFQTAQQYDLPDLSTPYIVGDASPAARITATATSLAVTSITNQYVTSTDINAVTDLLFSQPTRRYAVAFNYSGAGAAVYNPAVNTFYTAANTAVNDRQICLNQLIRPTSQNRIFDREETTPGVGGTIFVISPNVPSAAATFLVCGETAVYSINAGASNPSALSATVNRGDISIADATYKQGWLTIATPGAAAPGLPILGGSFIRASNTTVNYGFLWNHKVTR